MSDLVIVNSTLSIEFKSAFKSLCFNEKYRLGRHDFNRTMFAPSVSSPSYLYLYKDTSGYRIRVKANFQEQN